LTVKLDTPSKANGEGIVEDFARYEFKYILDLRLRQLIENEISHFMEIDGHTDPALDHQYFVRSLYFDSPGNFAFYEKTDGVKTRHKFRIRTYGNVFDGRSPILLEEKGRHNERTYKTRTQIDYDHLSAFIHNPKKVLEIDQYRDIAIVQKFVSNHFRSEINPKVLVDYLRRPYTSQFDMNFRITFDHKIYATATNQLFGPLKSSAKLCLRGSSIMEVKFNRRIPAWFHRILQAYDLRRVSVSKFVVGMKTCGLAIDHS
jgi:hypothetical protein